MCLRLPGIFGLSCCLFALLRLPLAGELLDHIDGELGGANLLEQTFAGSADPLQSGVNFIGVIQHIFSARPYKILGVVDQSCLVVLV